MSWRGKFIFVAAIGLFFVAAELFSQPPGGVRADLDPNKAVMRFWFPDGRSSLRIVPDQDGDGLADFAQLSRTEVGVNWRESLERFRIIPDYSSEHYTLFSGASGEQLHRWDGIGQEELAPHEVDGALCVHATHKKVERCMGPVVCHRTYPKKGWRASRSEEAADPPEAPALMRFEGEELILSLAELLSSSLFEGRFDFTPGAELRRLLVANGNAYSLYTTSTGTSTDVIELARDGVFTGKRVASFDAPKTIGSWGRQNLAAAEQAGRYMLARAIMDSKDPYPVRLLTKVAGHAMNEIDLGMEIADFDMNSTLQAMRASGCGAWATGATKVELIPIEDRNGDDIRDWQFFADIEGGTGANLAIGLLSGATGELLPR